MASREKNSRALGLGFVFGSLADADFIVAHYTSHPALHHHYFSHSISFALALTAFLWAGLKLLRFASANRWSLILGVAYGTHLLLDYFTEDGSFPYGIPLLWPFTNKHFVAPLSIFYSIHRGDWDAIFSPSNLKAISMELAVMIPVTLLTILLKRQPGSHQNTKGHET